MAKILKIYNFQDPILRVKCRDIEYIDKWVLDLTSDMWLTMLMSKAFGLAANQVGYDYNIISIDGPDFKGPMINPVIVEKSNDVFHFSEGCLSMPGFAVNTGRRSKNIKVNYLDLTGKQETVTLENKTAVIVQHEIDHLRGLIMTDHLNEEMLK